MHEFTRLLANSKKSLLYFGIILIIVLLVLTGLFFYFSSKKTPETETKTPVKGIQESIIESLSIPSGTKVPPSTSQTIENLSVRSGSALPSNNTASQEQQPKISEDVLKNLSVPNK